MFNNYMMHSLLLWTHPASSATRLVQAPLLGFWVEGGVFGWQWQ